MPSRGPDSFCDCFNFLNNVASAVRFLAFPYGLLRVREYVDFRFLFFGALLEREKDSLEFGGFHPPAAWEKFAFRKACSCRATYAIVVVQSSPLVVSV